MTLLFPHELGGGGALGLRAWLFPRAGAEGRGARTEWGPGPYLSEFLCGLLWPPPSSSPPTQPLVMFSLTNSDPFLPLICQLRAPRGAGALVIEAVGWGWGVSVSVQLGGPGDLSILP